VPADNPPQGAAGYVAIPDFQTLMLPLLESAADGGEHRVRDLELAIAARFNLSTSDREQLLPSGRQTVLDNRLQWAKSYLKQAGLVEPAGRGLFRITDRGRATLAERPSRVDKAYLMRFPEYMKFWERYQGGGREPPASDDVQTATPEEIIESTWRQLQQQVADDLLDRILQSPTTFFERLVVDLLVAMGYGGSRADAGRSVGRSGDGGIDGIINEDPLGLDTVYIQAKRWQGPVGRPAVQGFAGSLEGFRARKGVLITTSTFTSDARDYVDRIEKRIVLLDGSTLARLMLEHGVGVTQARNYVIPRVDTDYFEQE
jgi:restriction system protein